MLPEIQKELLEGWPLKQEKAIRSKLTSANRAKAQFSMRIVYYKPWRYELSIVAVNFGSL
jgi:hypothetical protein